MRTFQVKYRVGLNVKESTMDVDALNSTSAKRKVERIASTGKIPITIVAVEDITGPEELKELMRF